MLPTRTPRLTRPRSPTAPGSAIPASRPRQTVNSKRGSRGRRLAPLAACTALLAIVLTSDRTLGQELVKDQPVSRTLITNARVFDGMGDELTGPVSVLIVENRIEQISPDPINPKGAAVVDAGGRTLMPGLIDAHVHLAVSAITPTDLLTGDAVYIGLVSGKAAHEMLLRGFTSVRDLGGPTLGLKRAIDRGVLPGPRIWPCGSIISQSGGHGDFRLPVEMPSDGRMTYLERLGAIAIADSPDDVRKRVREQLALGATQIKLMVGGGVSSSYDPLDVTQYSVQEIRAAVEAAENWGTYVTVHAYTPRAVRQALEAGVKCIDHGQLLDEATAKLIADKGAWWSLQPFLDDGNSPYPKGSPQRAKHEEMMRGTDVAYRLAKKLGIKVAFGSDVVMDPPATRRQGQDLVNLTKWFTPVEALRMATSGNAELLALSGPRNPYPGIVGVVEPGALADLIVVDGDPITDLKLLADPDRNIRLVMKDGKIYKNTLP